MIFRTPRSQVVKFAVGSASVLVLFLACAAPLHAQSQGDNRLFNDNGGSLSDFERQRRLDGDMRQRGLLRNGSARDIRAAGYFWSFVAIQKNTAKLREANGNLQQAIGPSQTPDYKVIAKYASKIRELTTSLRRYLYVPRVNAPTNQLEAEPALTVEQLRASAQALDRLVELFLLNQVVQRPGVVDGQLRLEAGQEARNLITQSTRVKRLADALRRNRRGDHP